MSIQNLFRFNKKKTLWLVDYQSRKDDIWRWHLVVAIGPTEAKEAFLTIMAEKERTFPTPQALKVYIESIIPIQTVMNHSVILKEITA